MSILITGGTGLIGSQLARMLVERGGEPILFDVAPDLGAVKPIIGKVKIVRGDLANWSEVFNVVKDYGVESIYHLGGMLSLPSDANPWAAYRVNANGTMHILEAARLFNVGKVIFTSTIATYAKQAETPIEIDEATVQRPENMYGITKLFCELLGRFYCKRFGLDFRAVRYPTVIGPGAKTKHMTQYLAWMIEYSIANRPFEVWVEEETRVPCIYYKDAARALLMLHDAPSQNIKTRVYTLAGISLTAREFVDTVKKHVPSAEITFKPDPEVVRMIGKGFGHIDDSPARNEWGWRVEYNLDEMIRDFQQSLKQV
ncbi:MAG: NAD-dependent epimerase/dehydratase family protein [Candidatus Bathyarchaeia archaeon]